MQCPKKSNIGCRVNALKGERLCLIHGRHRSNARTDWNSTLRRSCTRNSLRSNKPIQTRTSKQNPRRLR